MLPFWRTALGPFGGVFFIWRRPIEVADSLAVRNGLTLSHGLALWEWYNHQAVLGMAGLPVFATSYDDVLNSEALFKKDVASWLSRQVGIQVSDAPVGDVVKPSLRHDHSHADRAGHILPEQQALIHVLDTLHGPYAPFNVPALPRVSQWTLDLLSARRDFEEITPLERASGRKALAHAFHVALHRFIQR
jgi:hypothetical protein